MNRTPVTSSNIVSVGHEGTTLEVEFKTGVYRYTGVIRALFEDLMASDSKGKFIIAHVKGHFPYEKVVA